MRTLATALTVALVLTLAVPMSADILRMKNGAEIDGTYLGGDARSVRFLGPDGTAQSYSVGDVAALEFGSTAPAPAAAPAPAPARSSSPRSRRAPEGVTVPAGTQISIRMIDRIDAKVTAIGEQFRASIDDPVVVDGETVIPRGADCTVQVMRAESGGRMRGRDELALTLFDITVKGQTYAVTTNYAELQSRSEGKETAKKTIGGAAAGALIGGILGGGKGALIGTAAGGGAGAAASAIKGPHLQVDPETRLMFELRAPLPLV